MSVEELVKELRQVAAFPRPIHKAPSLMEQAADKLEELATESNEWEERFWKRDAQADRLMQERDKAEAALAEKDKEIAVLREACNQSRLAFAGMVSVQSAIDKLDARNAGGKDAE